MAPMALGQALGYAAPLIILTGVVALLPSAFESNSSIEPSAVLGRDQKGFSVCSVP